MMIDGCEPPRHRPIGLWCLEEDSAVCGSNIADVFLAVSRLLRLALDGLGTHVN